VHDAFFPLDSLLQNLQVPIGTAKPEEETGQFQMPEN